MGRQISDRLVCTLQDYWLNLVATCYLSHRTKIGADAGWFGITSGEESLDSTGTLLRLSWSRIDGAHRAGGSCAQ
eukprot:SAG31_NODE_39272_length_289_cov_1.300000_1_plen_74_part_01